MSIEPRVLELAILVTASVAAAAGALVHARRARQAAGRLADGSWRWLPGPPPSSTGAGSPWLIGGACICFVAALVLILLHEPGERDVGGARVIVLAMDVSQSMYAGDAEPSRIERGRAQMLELVGRAPGYSFGVVAFAGDGALALPVTPDRESVVAALKMLGPASVATRGSSLGQGLALAVETARLAEGQDVIVVSDGESTQDDDLLAPTVKRAAELGVRIHSVSVGTSEGSPVPADAEEGSAGARTYPDGRPVVTRMDEEKLRRISVATSGYHASADRPGAYLGGLVRATTDPASARRDVIKPEQALILFGALLVSFDGLRGLRRRVRVRVRPGG